MVFINQADDWYTSKTMCLYGTGLEIHVKASDVYLIPEYVDVDHKDHDDEEFVMKANTFPEDIKNLLRSIRRSHCRYFSQFDY
jgi:hypothetical protein